MSSKPSQLQEKLDSLIPLEALTSTDIAEIFNEIELIKFFKTSFFDNLTNKVWLCCRQDHKSRMGNKIEARFKKHLDIRSFVNVHTNLTLLLHIFLTKE